jgi:cysteine desulfurase/selenocysteine lyase
VSFDPARLRREFPLLADADRAGRPIHYLDNAATAQVPEVVIEAVAQHDRRLRSNVARGVYRLAEDATAAYEAAREEVAAYVGARPDEIVFAGNCTAAINIAALAFGETLAAGDRVVVSELDHHSNIVPWQLLASRRGIALDWWPATPEGTLDPARLGALVGPRTRLIAASHGSNVTGARLDVRPVVEAAKRVGAKVLLDGAQVVPHGALDLSKLGIDFYAFSGHKMYGPTGIGVLWGRRALLEALPPAFGGGGMIGRVAKIGASWAAPPARFEAGTPPVAQAVGLAAAVNWIRQLDRGAVEAHLQMLTTRLIDGLQAIDAQRRVVRLVGPPAGHARLPVVSFDIKGAHPHDICQMLAETDVCLRGGHHCAQPLMDALGLAGTTRASLAPYNDENDVDALLEGVDRAIARLT